MSYGNNGGTSDQVDDSSQQRVFETRFIAGYSVREEALTGAYSAQSPIIHPDGLVAK